MNDTRYTDKEQVNILTGLCAEYGLRKAVISPGSRSAPLALAFHYQPEIECFVIPDERSAAYFALGIAQFTQQPVAMICTSGTAALNYAPAIAEAFHQKLPLLAITADRPPEWVGQLDGQTINQTGIYGNFVSFEAQLPVSVFSKHEVWHIEHIVRDAFLQMNRNGLPVHLNVPLREPLYTVTDQKTPEGKSSVYFPVKHLQANDIPDDLESELQRYSRILIILGMNRPNKEMKALVAKIAELRNTVILAENLSNVKGAFPVRDALLYAVSDQNPEQMKPDLVISFGDNLLSKPLKQWIRALQDTEHWVVYDRDFTPDVFQKIEKIIRLSPVAFLQNLLKHVSFKTQDFFKTWEKAFHRFDQLQLSYTNTVPLSDMMVFKVLSEEVPEGSVVHLGNSSPVRYAQFFSWKKDILFYCNRGTAGIDGCTSTAVGMSTQTDNILTLITGDVSFLYDSNGLWNAYKRSNFKIIVINNKGGNIFSLISGPQNTGLLNEYFLTHIPVSIENLCKAYGMEYFCASTEEDLRPGLNNLYSSAHCSLLEIHTAVEVNTKVWKEYFRIIRQYKWNDQE